MARDLVSSAVPVVVWGRSPRACRYPAQAHPNKGSVGMANALSGFRVLEVAAWTFVPAAGAVLADWGADVIKVEHPQMGDPQRGLVSMGLIPGGDRGGQLHHRAAQPGQAEHRHRHQHRRRARPPLQAGRDVRRLPHQLPPGGAPAAEDRRRAHPGGQPGHRLRPRLGPGAARPRPREGRVRRVHYWGRGGVANALTPADSEWPIGGRAGLRRPGRGHGHRRRDRRRPPAAGHHRRGPGHRRLAARAWPCGCSPPTSWPPGSTAATRCPSSTAARPRTHWSATTGPATAGSSR